MMEGMEYDTDDIEELSPADAEERAFITHIHNRYIESVDHSQDWREEAVKAYRYVANDQWDDEERAYMDEQERPLVSFNRSEIFIQAILGLEALNRQEVRYLPRRKGPVNSSQAELWTAAAQYVNDDADAEIHHSTAFRDLVIAGMGWTDTRMAYDTNPDGDICIERLDPLMCYWDPRSMQRNLSDSRWRMTVFPLSEQEVRERWPEKAEDLTYSRIFEPGYIGERMHDASRAWRYENDQSRRTVRQGEEIYVAHYQWYETRNFYRVIGPDGSPKDFSEKDWRRFREKFPNVVSKLRVVGPIPKRQYYRAYVAGWTLLERTPIAFNDFTLQVMTGKHDRNKNLWYGQMRNLFDPQDWVNKLFSQIMFIINSNAKGGLLAERDAFENPQKAEDQWASPDSIVWMNPRALQDGKVTPKPPSPYPQGLDRLLQFSMQIFPDVTGENIELLGLAEKVQPGVLEAQRKQAGMTMLAWAFDALRAYRKAHGRVLAQFISEFIADGRLIRIAGKEGEQYIPLIRDELAMEYDVIVAESPQSTNERERVFAILMDLLPTLAQLGSLPPPEILDYLPLPAPLTEAWKQQLNNPQQQQAAQEAQQLEKAQQQADVQETQSKAQLNQAKAEVERIKAATGG